MVGRLMPQSTSQEHLEPDSLAAGSTQGYLQGRLRQDQARPTQDLPVSVHRRPWLNRPKTDFKVGRPTTMVNNMTLHIFWQSAAIVTGFLLLIVVLT